jgi:hypothetical protein
LVGADENRVETMADIGSIPGLTSPEPNVEYQNLVRDAVWESILVTTRHPVSGQSILRNEDTISALLDLIALFAASSSALSSPEKVGAWADGMGKRLRSRTLEAQRATDENGSFADDVIDLTRGSH